MPDENATGLVEKARAALRDLAPGKLLERLKETAPKSLRATLVRALADGLRTIPVPLVGSFLARLAEDTLKPENQGPSLEDLLALLEEMQTSDEQFRRGLERLGGDLDELQRDVEAIRETQVGTEFRLARTKLDLRWPAFDHRLAALLVNRGGGLVVLDEVHLDVEGWTVLTRADLSVPAAPLAILRLKALLDVTTKTYPLFALNGEGPHQFAQGLGAERLELDFESRHNARYQLRLRLAYYDERADSERELAWPPLGTPPFELDFPWAPGFRPTMELLEAKAVLADIEARLSTYADWLERKGDPAELEPLGIPEYQAHPGFVFSNFVRLLERDVAAHPDASPALRNLVARVGRAS
ncbi:MAG TPA: hypothetical protein VKY73_05625 [Polyangiaceae bacterium]|nr:hypothetical protein [Polyangiaceae bacterium]